MSYRLLVDSEAVNVLISSPVALRTRLLIHLERLRASPFWHADYEEISPAGRRLQVSIFAGHSFHYWVDDADRHVKVLDIRSAGR